MSDQSSSPPTEKKARGRLWWLVLPLLAVLAGGGGLLAWRFWPVAPPPEVAAAGLDPKVVEVITAARQRVVSNPRSATAWGDLGMTLRVHGYESEGNVCFARAGELDPKDSRWPYFQALSRLQHDPANALPPLRRAAELAEGDSSYGPSARLRLAEALGERGEYEEADRLFRREQENPDFAARCGLGLGTLAMARDDLNSATGHFRAATNSPFARKKATSLLANVARRLGDTEAAALERQADDAPEDLPWPDAYIVESQRLEVGRQSRFARATQLETQGQVAQAVRLLAEVARDYPDEHSLVPLGMALIKLQDFHEAERVLREAVRLAPGHVQAHHFLGSALYLQAEQLGDGAGQRADVERLLRAAVEEFARASELKPDHATAHFLEGMSRKKLGEKREAIVCFRRAVECRPEIDEPLVRLGETLIEVGEKEEGRRKLEDAAALGGPHAGRAREVLKGLE